MNRGREKGDIYRHKRKMYILASELRGGIKEGYLNPDIADDVLECYRNYSDKSEIVIPSGNEFKAMPPTAAGRRYFADSLGMLMHDRDRFSDMVKKRDEGQALSVEELFSEGLEDIVKVIDKVISDYFTASGLTPEDEPIKDKAVRKKGREDFLISRREYEKVIKENLREYGVHIIEKLGKEDFANKEESLLAKDVTDPLFEAMVESEPLGYLLYDDVLRELSDTTKRSMKESIKYKASVSVFKEKIFPSFFSKDMDSGSHDILKVAFLEYRNYIEKNLKRQADIRESCLYYGKCLLKGEPVDRIMYKKIKDNLNLEAELIDDSYPLTDLPGFKVISSTEAKKIKSPKDLDEINKLTGEVKRYYETHPYQFDGQCLISALSDTELLSRTLDKAEAISAAIDDFSKSKKAQKLKPADWFDLLDCWVLCECLMRSGYPIIDFINEHQKDTVGEATQEFLRLLPDISYSTAERTVRFALREVIIERSGFNVSRE